jgi:hypothetical protein
VDRLFLEIVTEGKIAQHFKKRMMAGGIADIVEIIMLAASTDAFLAGRRRRKFALFGTGKNILERHHTGIDEHQWWIIVRNER